MVIMDFLILTANFAENLLAKIKSNAIQLVEVLPENFLASSKVRPFIDLLDLYILWIKEIRNFVNDFSKPKTQVDIELSGDDSGTETDEEEKASLKAQAEAKRLAHRQFRTLMPQRNRRLFN